MLLLHDCCVCTAGLTQAHSSVLRESELEMLGGPLQSAQATQADFGVRLLPPTQIYFKHNQHDGITAATLLGE